MQSLGKLIEEMNQFKPGDAMEITDAITDNDLFVATIPDDLLQLRALGEHYQRRAAEAGIDSRFNTNADLRRNFAVIGAAHLDKATFIFRCFWAELEERFDLWGCNLAVRNGWQLVRTGESLNE